MTNSGITVFGRPSQTQAAYEVPSEPDALGFPRNYVTLDLETTGFYPNRCAITEIGAVRVRDGHIVDQFQELVNPLRPIPRQITALTGISDAMVADLDPIDDVLPRFISWLADTQADSIAEPIVGHNVSFDLRFLDYNTRHIAGVPFACMDYDTMQISRVLFPAHKHHRLADLIVRFGIAENEEHRALSDAIQTQECLEWMHQYTAEHCDAAAIDWRSVPAKTSTEIIHQQLILR
ncbi:3'-5' exonuclease [Bifidobacterium cebidarum]|uniref:DNA polymerase III subunit epsilon n=1 Tax=Bifidobacterium cebidarum TaxID=2650773 RepID=A0A6I1GE49_9BIFI|nr:3'-5' exonuclease [Bifidobacterium cebidarum]KAB7786546.1 DNA polymerase III subunit epsilon [Bifidobacterium cebidarum]